MGLEVVSGARFAKNDSLAASPHGWLQWKGTDACIDFRCACNDLHHYDGLFAYQVRMPCGRVYALAPEIMLIELDAPLLPDEVDSVREAD